MVIRSGQMKQCNWLCGLSSVPSGTSGAKPGHLAVPKTTFGIPGQSVPNRDCPGKTRDSWSAWRNWAALHYSKLTNRPGFSGTVPVWDTLSRNPERCIRDAQMSGLAPNIPARTEQNSIHIINWVWAFDGFWTFCIGSVIYVEFDHL